MNPGGYRLLMAGNVPLALSSLFRARPLFPWLLPWSLPAQKGARRLWPVAPGFADRARASLAEGGVIDPLPLPYQLREGVFYPEVISEDPPSELPAFGYAGSALLLAMAGGVCLWRRLSDDGAIGSWCPLAPPWALVFRSRS